MLQLIDFWAKTTPFQSVLTHGVISGYIAQAIYDEMLSGGVQKKLSNLLGMEGEKVRSFLGYLTSLHDIGKIEPEFQCRDQKMKEQIQQEGFPITRSIAESIRHEKTSEKILHRIWNEAGFDRRAAMLFGEIERAHHQGKSGKGKTVNGLWAEYHQQYEKQMREQFAFDGPLPKYEKEEQGGLSALLLGILILSDWIASNHAFADAETWAWTEGWEDTAREKAHEFIVRSGLRRTDAAWSDSFCGVWPNIPSEGMRPLQREAEMLFQEETERFSVVLLEAPMGEGKTEAGMYAALQMMRQWGKSGFYVALPTAATSNQMVKRMRNLVKMHGMEKTVHLLHGMAWLVDDQTPEEESNSEDENDEIRRWLAPLRRGLLASYGVGTVDQAMLAVTKVRYGVLRLLGLSNKVLVIDEIHSYDVYMSEFIVLLLEWCKALEIPVVMLSATLPPDMKQRLLVPFDVREKATCYPAITAVTESGKQIVRAIPETTRRQSVSVRLSAALDQPEKIAAVVTEKVSEGGCICVLLNTVRQAQETYLALKKVFQGELILFHAQFPAERRREIEQFCLECFGPDKTKRPRQAILVASQVVEQSLDVDFDAMITAVAPIDLLLQRMGRVFRHSDTKRPAKFSCGHLDVLVPQIEDDFESDEKVFGADGIVYPPNLLRQSIHLLREKESIRIPEDLAPLVADGYDMAQAPEETWEEWIQQQIEESIEAGSSEGCKLSPPDKKFSPLISTDLFGYDEGEDKNHIEVKTRLGEPTVRIALLEPELYHDILLHTDKTRTALVSNRKLAQAVLGRSVSIAKRRLHGVDSDPAVVKGGKLLYGVLMYPAENDVFLGENGMSITFDKELGVVIKDGES